MRREQSTLAPTEGILVADVEDGVFEAFRALRHGLEDLAEGRHARATFLTALTDDGAIASRGHEAHILLLGYRLD